MISVAEMVFNRLDQVRGSSVVKEEHPLAQSPERGGTKLIAPSASLGDIVGELRSHVVEEEIGEQVCLNVAERGYARLPGGE